MEDLSGYRPRYEPPKFQLELHFSYFKVSPLAIKAVLVGVVRIYFEYINIHEIGLIHSGPPAMLLCKPNTHGWGAGEQSAHDIEPLVRLDMCFIPGDRTCQGLMRINNEVSRAIICAVGCNRGRVRANGFFGLWVVRRLANRIRSLITKKCQHGLIETIKKRVAKHVACNNIFTGYGQQLWVFNF